MIYFVVLFVIIVGAYLYDGLPDKNKGNKYYWMCCCFLILLFGFRYRVGGDTLNYIIKYELIPDLKDLTPTNLLHLEVEPGFALLMSGVKGIFNSFYGVQVIESIVVNVTWFFLIKQRVRRKFLGVILFYIMGAFYFNTEIMREAIAISFFIIAYGHLEKGDIKKYYLILLLGITFHYSCLFMLFIPQIRKYVTCERKMWIMIIILYLVSMVAPLFFSYFGGYLGVKIENSSSYRLNIWGVTSMVIKTWIFPYYVAHLYKKYNDNAECSNEVRFIYIYMIIGSLSFGDFSMLMRLSNYMLPFFVVILANVIDRINWGRTKNAFAMVCTCVLVWFCYITYYTSDVSSITRGAHYYNLWYPYHSILDEQEEPLRESFVNDQFENIRNRH